MCIRFVWNRPHPVVDAEAGLFDAYWTLTARLDRAAGAGRHWTDRRAGVSRVEHRCRQALHEASRALRELDAPKLSGGGRVRGGREALFWFRIDAALEGRGPRTMIYAAKDLVYALMPFGIEVRSVESRRPGAILWQDAHQVLARPEGRVARAFIPSD